MYFPVRNVFKFDITIEGLFLCTLQYGISFKYFSFYESFRKTGKFRACRGNHPAALKLEANKKDI